MTDQEILKSDFASIGRTFRGEIYEDDRDVPMIDAYANDGKPFDIGTCQYLREPFQIANRPTTRLIALSAANQIFKTGFCELVGKHKAKHDPGHMTFYDMEGDSAKDHAKTRIMPFFKSIPGIGDIIREIEADNRFDVTTTDIQLPGMILRVRPLNETNTQRITSRYIFIHDAALSGKNGQIRRAMVRATQYEGRELIVIESQAGIEGDDFTRIVESTNDARLWVKCPCCEMNQPFLWHRPREQEFVPTPPKTVPSLDRESWLNHWTPIFRSPDRAHAGFKRGDEILTKMPDGKYDEKEIMRGTHYECYHCGEKWIDDGRDGATRKAIDASSHYVSERQTSRPGYYGFRIPRWINTRISWGKVMVEYLKAKHDQNVFANELPLQEWYQKVAAETWKEGMGSFTARVSDTIYNPNEEIDGMVAKFCLIDCQQDLQHFWVDVWAVKEDASIRLVETAHVREGGGKTAKQNVEEIVARHKIPPNHVAVDGAHRFDEVLQWAGDNAYIGPVKTSTGKVIPERIMTWRVLIGNKMAEFRWPDGRKMRYDYGYKGMGNRYPVVINRDGKKRAIYVLQTNVSTLRFADLARRYRDNDNAPAMEIDLRLDREAGLESYQEQLNSEFRTTEHGRAIWKKKSSSVHNHRWDNLKNLLAMMDIHGLLSINKQADEEEAES